MPNQRPNEEKRDFIRVNLACEIHLQHAASGHRFIAGSRNLSAGGVLFQTDECLAPGDLLEMHIEASQMLFSVLDATIEVVRVESPGEGGPQLVGGAIRTIHDMNT